MQKGERKMDNIVINLTTVSNLFIGDTPSAFEIGGVDSYTITDLEGNPYIPASSYKGVLKRIAREMEEDGDSYALEIAEKYRIYLEALKEANEKKQAAGRGKNLEKDRITAMWERFDESIRGASVQYLFGIQGFNNSPKLIFNDLLLARKKDNNELFSIDTKNTIVTSAEGVKAMPRTYKTVCPGVEFTGEILLYRMEQLNAPCVKEFIEKALREFNHGIYRLGNSGSRGYGRVKVSIGQKTM